MRKPLFLQSAPPPVIGPARLGQPFAARINAVSWQQSPPEPALPELVPVVVASPLPPPLPPPPAPLAGFEPVRSEPPKLAGLTPQAEQQLEAALTALKHQGERLAEQARSDALELGILIARRILEQELAANLEGVFALIKSAIRRAGEDHVTRVRLSPADVGRFEAAARSDFSLGRIELVADVELQPGDVMVDTEAHTVDGRLATRFDEVIRQLSGARP